MQLATNMVLCVNFYTKFILNHSTKNKELCCISPCPTKTNFFISKKRWLSSVAIELSEPKRTFSFERSNSTKLGNDPNSFDKRFSYRRVMIGSEK